MSKHSALALLCCLSLGVSSAADAQTAAPVGKKPAAAAKRKRGAPAAKKKAAPKAAKKPKAAKAKPAAAKPGAAKPGAETAAAKEKPEANATAAKPPLRKSKKIKVTWLGHAAFEIVSGEGTVLLIDPFLTGNPKTPKAKQDLTAYRPDAILVTHSHPDHLGDAVALAKQSGAPVIGSHEFIKTLALKEDRKMGGNVGGKMTIKDVEVHLVPAIHGSTPGGRPLGFVLKFKTGQVLYHSGDTWIFGDMALINEIHKPTILLMNCGGGPYTQDPKTCALATKKYFKKAKTIIPMHFGTFPPLATEADVKKGLAKFKKKVKVLKPGGSIEL